MDEGEGPSEASIDLRLDRQNDQELQVDTATFVAAKSFGAIALPLTIPFAQAAAIESQANFTQQLDGIEAFLIGGANSGPVNDLTPEQRQKRIDDEALAYLTLAADAADEQREQERERQEWSHTVSTLGGVSMKGDEWAALAELLRSDEDLHRRLIEAFEKRGMTHDEAEKRYKRVADVAEIASIPPSQRTEDEAAALEKANADPTFKKDMQDVERLKAKNAMGAHIASSAGSPRVDAATSQPVDVLPPAEKQPQMPPVTIMQGPGF